MYAGDKVVKEAHSKDDIAGLLEGIATSEVSKGCIKNILKEMLAGNDLDNASKVIISVAKNKGNKYTKIFSSGQ